MLLKNKLQIYETPGNLFGGVLINERNNFKKTFANRFISEDGGTYDKQASIPLGTEAVYSYLLAVNGGGLVSHTIEGSGSNTGYQSNGINVVSNITGDGQMLASISLIISMLSDITGDGEINASLSLLIKMATGMVGSGQMTGALSLLAGIIGILSGSVAITASLRGTQTMASDITPFTELSPQNLSQYIWNTIASEYNESGTMGQKLNSASSGGVDYAALTSAVWSDITTYSSGTKGYNVDNSGGASVSAVDIREEMDNNSLKLNKIDNKSTIILANTSKRLFQGSKI